MRRLRGDRGVTAVEAALVLAFIILPLMLAATDLGLWAYQRSEAAEAAREASRVAMINPVATTSPLTSLPDSASPLYAVWNEAVAELGMHPSDFSLDVSCSPACTPGGIVTVTVTWTRPSLTLQSMTRHVTGSSTRTIVGSP